MATLGDLQQRVALRLKDANNTAVAVTTITDAINASIKHRKKTRYWFNETSVPVTVSAGTNIIPVTGLVSVNPRYGMKMSYQTGYIDLPRLDPMVVDNNQYGQLGTPRGYFFRDGKYQTFYTADIDYTITVYGLEDYAPLVLTTDSNDFTENADDMIMYDTLGRLMGDIRQDSIMSDYFVARANDEEQTLLDNTNNITSTGRNIPDYRSTTLYDIY